jgi:hypothetical protein
MNMSEFNILDLTVSLSDYTPTDFWGEIYYNKYTYNCKNREQAKHTIKACQYVIDSLKKMYPELS